MKKKIFLAAIMLFVHTVHAQISPGQILQAGERLEYKVKWNFLRIGTIIVRTERDTTAGDSSFYRLFMTVASNPALMFLHILEFNESLVSGYDPHSRKYMGKHLNGDDSVLITYSYDPRIRRASCFEKNLRTGEIRYNSSHENVPPYVEGASLLLYARCKSHSGKAYNVPTMVGNELHNTRLEFRGEKDDLSVDIFPQHVRSVKYSGFADWSGGSSAGVSGEFNGWVSDDDAAIPLRAEMKVLLGSITIELEKWNRAGWTPPTALQTSF